MITLLRKLNKLKSITFFLLAAFLLSACGTAKSVTELPYSKRKKFEHLYLEAAKQKVLGNTDKAVGLFEEALKVYPTSHEAMYQLAGLYFRQSEYYLALEWSQKSVSTIKEYNHWYYGQLAQCYFQIGKFEQSAKTFEKMINEEPRNAELYVQASNQYLNANDPARAVDMLNKLEERIGISETSATKKEYIFLKLGRTDDAIEALRALVETFPDIAVYRGYLGETLMKTGRTQEAIKELLLMEQLDSTYGRTQMLLFELYAKQGDDLMSYVHLKKAFRLPDVDIAEKINAFTPYFVGFNINPYIKIQAIELSDMLLIAHPNRDIPYIVKGDIYHKMDSLEKSREYFAIAVEKEGSDYRTWDKLISMDAKLKRSDWQLEDSERAIERYPNMPGFYLAKAYALYDLERMGEAAEAAETGLEIATEAVDKIELLSCLASCYDELGKFELSEHNFKKALELDSRNVLIMNNFAYALARRGAKLDLADSLINTVFSIDARNPFYMDTKAWVEYKKGNIDEAIEWINKAIKIDPMGYEYFEHLAEIYKSKGDLIKAQEYLERAQELGSKIEVLDEIVL